MNDSHSPRVLAFRKEMIRLMPRVPNDRVSRDLLRSMPTRSLIGAFLTWRMRLVPAKPRTIGFWSGGVLPARLRQARRELQPFFQKVEAGEDLTPHLSDLVNRKGVVLPGASRTDHRADIDMVLTRQGLHHFHVGAVTAANPMGRSDTLVFAEVLETEFRVIAIADHAVFDAGSPEHQRFFEICTAYMAKDIPPGQGFMANPVASSGHSMIVTMFAVKCEDVIRRLDVMLDDPAFIGTLYGQQPIATGGQTVRRPGKPVMNWHFEDLQFGILDRTTRVFFCIFPFFAR